MPSNFTFLEHEFPLLYNIGNTAEFYYHQDPVYCLAKLRAGANQSRYCYRRQKEERRPNDAGLYGRVMFWWL